MTTIKGHAFVYLSPYGGTKASELGDGTKLDQLQLLTADFFDAPEGWTKVGTAEVVVTLHPRDTIITDAVSSLRAQQNQVRADAEKRATELERQIQSLLAIAQ